ncbi:MAG: hypothetical protein WDN00_14630 [Limisphaerales bacterium]
MNAGAVATQDELPKSEPQASLPPDKKSASPWAKAQKMLEVAAPQGATARATTWVSKLNPVSMFRNSSSPWTKLSRPCRSNFSLEKIKVVHNDLSDADVEVVPMKSRPARLAPDSKPRKNHGKIWASGS